MLDIKRIENCFPVDFIGIRGLCDGESESGYYINDEVDITVNKLAKLANSEDKKATKLLERLSRNAIRETANDFLEYLAQYSKIEPVKNSFMTFDVILQASEILDLTKFDKYKDLEIVKIENSTLYPVWVQDSDTPSKKIVEAATLKRHIQFSSDKEKLYIYASNSAIETYVTQTCKLYENSYCDCGCYSYQRREIELGEFDIPQTGCIKITFKCDCSFSELICQNKILLSRAIYFHTVGLVFKEKMTSNVIDPYIQNTREEAGEMYNEFLNGYEDKNSKYKDALIFAAKVAKSKIGLNNCFKCRGVEVKNLM